MSKTTDAIQYCKYTLHNISNYAGFKTAATAIFILLANIFSSLNYEGIIICYFLMIGDFITGIIASHMVGDKIRSAKLIRTVEKMALYGVLVMSGLFVDKLVGINIGQSATVVFVGLTEAISIMENIGRSGLPIPKKLLGQIINIKNDK